MFVLVVEMSNTCVVLFLDSHEGKKAIYEMVVTSTLLKTYFTFSPSLFCNIWSKPILSIFSSFPHDIITMSVTAHEGTQLSGMSKLAAFPGKLQWQGSSAA